MGREWVDRGPWQKTVNRMAGKPSVGVDFGAFPSGSELTLELMGMAGRGVLPVIILTLLGGAGFACVPAKIKVPESSFCAVQPEADQRPAERIVDAPPASRIYSARATPEAQEAEKQRFKGWLSQTWRIETPGLVEERPELDHLCLETARALYEDPELKRDPNRLVFWGVERRKESEREKRSLLGVIVAVLDEAGDRLQFLVYSPEKGFFRAPDLEGAVAVRNPETGEVEYYSTQKGEMVAVWPWWEVLPETAWLVISKVEAEETEPVVRFDEMSSFYDIRSVSFPSGEVIKEEELLELANRLDRLDNDDAPFSASLKETFKQFPAEVNGKPAYVFLPLGDGERLRVALVAREGAEETVHFLRKDGRVETFVFDWRKGPGKRVFAFGHWMTLRRGPGLKDLEARGAVLAALLEAKKLRDFLPKENASVDFFVRVERTIMPGEEETREWIVHLRKETEGEIEKWRFVREEFGRVLTPISSRSESFKPNTGSEASQNRYLEISEVPPLRQSSLNLGGEGTAGAMLARYHGKPEVEEADIISHIPPSPDDNPHNGAVPYYVKEGEWIEGYVAYAEPIAQALQELGLDAQAAYMDIDRLKNKVENGNPVMVWITFNCQEPKQAGVERENNSVKMALVAYPIVVVGIDNESVIVNDPFDGTQKRFSLSDFKNSWRRFGNVAVFISD